ncbi:GFA family protein [Hoeflea prorocentri]|uniref:GFA family protein n=1 Tax=Hoeflea prorocentri TaxID=1922333 RepID=A0A9X3ZH33_9HYPH|nr:GFA family protein [Hoeflea prorocentri]MDA5398303.1 GFA family protein [Hoeflea prorocentri]
MKFRSDAEPVLQAVCHCADCRNATGNDYSETVFFAAKATEVAGELRANRYFAASGAQTVREFCSVCGTPMFDKSDGFPQLIGVFAQTISEPFRFVPDCHMWTKGKLAHVQISDDLRTYEEGIS